MKPTSLYSLSTRQLRVALRPVSAGVSRASYASKADEHNWQSERKLDPDSDTSQVASEEKKAQKPSKEYSSKDVEQEQKGKARKEASQSPGGTSASDKGGLQKDN